MRRFFALSRSGNKFRNVREARLIANVNAGNAARRVATLRPSPQPRGSEESRLLDEIHERVDLQHEIACSTFSRRMGVTVELLWTVAQCISRTGRVRKTQNRSFVIQPE